jgi:hypothetical protein
MVRSWARFPATAAPASSRAVSWAGVRVTDNEPRFSSTRDARRVPGILERSLLDEGLHVLQEPEQELR